MKVADPVAVLPAPVWNYKVPEGEQGVQRRPVTDT